MNSKNIKLPRIVHETRNLRGSQCYEVEKRQVKTEEEEESEDEEERRGTGATRTSQTADCEKPFNVHSTHIKKSELRVTSAYWHGTSRQSSCYCASIARRHLAALDNAQIINALGRL
jgi:hypothetical protein